MAFWRVGPGWSSETLKERLEGLEGLPRNFRLNEDGMTPETGWNTYFSEAVIAREEPGPPRPEGPFRRAEVGVASYQFSDPTIVIGHFDPESRLLGRRILLEMKALRVFRYLAGVVVGAVRFEERDGEHVFGFRYDTLTGHIERGVEWFLLTKHAETGEITFRIEAAWLPGEFPNWWSRTGFRFLGPRYQRAWHQQAHLRLSRIAHGESPASPLVDEEGVAHAGPTVTFERKPRLTTVPTPIWEDEEIVQS